jgi:hypothetical protein
MEGEADCRRTRSEPRLPGTFRRSPLNGYDGSFCPMGISMKRRHFIALLGGAGAWPLAARSQQPAVTVIGLLVSESAASFAGSLAALRQGLSDPGYVVNPLGPTGGLVAQVGMQGSIMPGRFTGGLVRHSMHRKCQPGRAGMALGLDMPATPPI